MRDDIFLRQRVKFLFACIFTAFTCGFFRSLLQMAVTWMIRDAHYRVCDLTVLCMMSDLVGVEMHANRSWSSLCITTLSRKRRTIAVVISDLFATTRHACFTNVFKNTFVRIVVGAAFVGSVNHSNTSLMVSVIWHCAVDMFFHSCRIFSCSSDHSLSFPSTGPWVITRGEATCRKTSYKCHESLLEVLRYFTSTWATDS